MMTSENAVRLAGAWLVDSGIQHNGKNGKLAGGVAAWYEADTGLYPFLYSEITGYAISAYLFLDSLKRSPKTVRCARRAADWIVRNAAQGSGGVKTRLYLVKNYESPNYSFHKGRVYSFDTAMVGYGLTQLVRKYPNPAYRNFADGLLRFLIDRMQRPDGTYWAYEDPGAGRHGQELDKWSDQSGSFHAKLALFFLDHARLTGESRGRKAAVRLLDTTLKAQKSDGRFVTTQSDQSTHLHPHAYTLEGLIYGGVHLDRADYRRAALKGFEWMLGAVSDDGSVSCVYAQDRFTHHERSDIVAQTLRIGAMLYAIDPKAVARHLPALERIKRHLLIFQYRGDGQAGGFIYGAATDGLVRFHFNAWSTMFALQALWMHEAFVVRCRPLRLDPFV